MGNRARQLDVAHPLAPHFRHCDFHATFLANHATMFQPFVFSTQAFVIAGRAEKLGAKQAVPFRFERPVVDGFGLLDFTIGPRTDLIWRRDSYTDGIKIFTLTRLMYQAKKVFHVFFLDSVLFDH